MTTMNKINSVQKRILADFMSDHPSLAKNILPNSAQGKSTAHYLWEELTQRLNSAGPPVKDAKTWRRVFADQKYQAKKKLSFNKAAKKKTGGGHFMEKLLTQAEEQLIEASGLEETVECNLSDQRSITPVDFQQLSETPFNSQDSFDLPTCSKTVRVTNTTKSNAFDTKTELLKENLMVEREYKSTVSFHLERLVQIQERMLEIKEEKHKAQIAVNNIELEKKTLQLDILKSLLKRNLFMNL